MDHVYRATLIKLNSEFDLKCFYKDFNGKNIICILAVI
jgi:hypothetical protein